LVIRPLTSHKTAVFVSSPWADPDSHFPNLTTKNNKKQKNRKGKEREKNIIEKE